MLRAPDELNDRAAPSTSLAAITAEIEAAFDAGDLATAAALIDQNLLAAWFGLPAGKLQRMFQVFARSQQELSPPVLSLRVFLSAGDEDRFFSSDAVEAIKRNSSPLFLQIAQMFDRRINGRPVEALEAVEELKRQVGALHSLYDGNQGWALFALVQQGVTAILAGEYQLAQRSLRDAQLHPLVPSLAFLHRDAYLREALVQAEFGDPTIARDLLARAELVPRTSSWAEETLDASETIVRALLDRDNPASAAAVLALDLRTVGEMWPFYVIAVQRTHETTDRVSEAVAHLEMIDSLALPKVDGQGLSGSALPLALACLTVRSGDYAKALALLERTDDRVCSTRLFTLMLESLQAAPATILKQALALRTQVRGFRKLELWRLALIAGSHLALQQHDDCRATLETALALPGGLTTEETTLFSYPVREFAEQRVAGWPPDGGEPAYFVDLEVTEEQLTQRERQVLELLADGLSRQEMAETLFVSVNTLKTQLQSVYRKLGARSRAEAILEATRRNML